MSWIPFYIEAAIAAAVLIVCAYKYFVYSFDYWKNRGVAFEKPVPVFGNFTLSCLGLKTFGDDMDKLYKKFKDNKYGGAFFCRRPALIVCDPETIKMILVKDFSSVMSHGFPSDEESDPLSAGLFNLDGDRWRNLRHKLSPVFTSGKMRLMVNLIVECADEMRDALKSDIKKSPDIDLHNLVLRFSTDVIGTCAFGVQCHSVKNPKSDFFLMSRKLFLPGKWFLVRFVLLSINRKWGKLVPFSKVFPGCEEFFLKLMKDTVEFRTKNNVVRNDFVDLLMELRKRDEEKIAAGHEISPDEMLTDNLMVAQMFIFFLAGLDAIANNVCYCIHELVKNKEMMDKVFEEVSTVLKKYDGKLSYEAIRDMKYVHCVALEGLRKYFVGGFLSREVTVSQYQVSGTDVVLDKGALVYLPIQSLHKDPEYFPDPHRFDPNRHSEEEIKMRHPMTFLPFGEGPRICIAQRFALMEMKLCIASLVRDFIFEPSVKGSDKIKIKNTPFGPLPVGGIWFNVRERNSNK